MSPAGRRLATALLVAAALALRPAGAPSAAPLAVAHGGRWVALRAAGSARWAGPDTVLTRALAWRELSPGVELAQARLAAGGTAWRTRLVVARLDPDRLRLDLDLRLSDDRAHPAWTIDRADSAATFAVNAGQFVAALPWGWLVVDGRERLSPGIGPLSLALVVDRAGRVRWVPGDSIAADPAARGRDARLAFQSYPALLWHDGVVPPPLLAAGRGVDLAHRDARLALGEGRDGRLLVAMTRFDALGGLAGEAPFGLTTPEMAAVMGALGCRDAVMLDGGISAQMMARAARTGERLRWPGLRRVPLGLVARGR